MVGIVERSKGASVPGENSNGSKNEQQNSLYSRDSELDLRRLNP